MEEDRGSNALAGDWAGHESAFCKACSGTLARTTEKVPEINTRTSASEFLVPSDTSHCPPGIQEVDHLLFVKHLNL